MNGERIEYFVKEVNTLRQLRRGTLGTGVKTTYPVSTKVFDQNISKTVPYKDKTLAYNATADGAYKCVHSWVYSCINQRD